MKGNKETYYSYGNIFSSTAEVFRPQNIEDLRTLLAQLQQDKRKVTVGGSFNSFDQQNSSKDAVISLINFNTIEYDPSNHTVTVGAGASWGEILDVVYQNKSVLFTCITGSVPTAGGTLSVNSNSTSTASVGKEGNHCISFDIMLTDGRLLTCSREQHPDLFYGAIAGFGLLGFITRITYQTFHVGSHYKISRTLAHHDNIEAIEDKIWLRKSPQLNELKDIQAQGSVFYMDNGTPNVSVHNAFYEQVDQKVENSKILFFFMMLASGFFRIFPSLVNKAIKADANVPANKRRIIKSSEAIHLGTFWVQPDYVWSKKVSPLFNKLGYEAKLYQNSYFIPEGEDKVTTFTKKVFELIQQYQLQVFMFDICYIPKDEPFVLSPSRNSGGFYVNTTFMDKTNKEDLLHCYSFLNELAYEMGGSLNLAKNCFIDPLLLEKMLAPNLEEMVALKKKYDPSHLITSNFFEEYFPSYFSL
jgi:FAD/FMN-containing dehydrogenase